MKAVIIAAGMGSRLWEETYNVPKTLLPYEGGTILSKIMDNFCRVGITDFVVVVGYHSHYIEDYLAGHKNGTYRVAIVNNPEWKRGNGISVLAAAPEVGRDSFMLSMSDHMVAPQALNKIAAAEDRKNSLLVDPNIDKIFDIDDATKVLCNDNRIIDIGKTIPKYNGIDCGIFKLTGRFFEKMKEALDHNEESISSAINRLIADNDMEAIFLEPNDKWIDIDTPEAYRYCLDNIRL